LFFLLLFDCLFCIVGVRLLWITVLLYLRFTLIALLVFVFTVFFRLVVLKVFTKAEVAVFVAAAPKEFAFSSQKQREGRSRSDLADIFISEFFDLCGIRLTLKGANSKLAVVVCAPRKVLNFAVPVGFDHSVVSPTFDIDHVGDVHSIEG
jgi:hypothetical protein